MNLIQQLKDNRYAWGSWTDPECYGPELGARLQKALMEITAKDGPMAVQRFAGEQGWVECSNNNYATFATLRLRADYAEEPEIVECEIFFSDDNGRLSHYDIDDGRHMSIDQAVSQPDFIGFKKDGWIWGCLYKNKKDPSMVHYMIKEHDLSLYDVIAMDGAKVLFRRQT